MENHQENFQPQLIEGELGVWDEHWPERLPEGIKPEQVDIYLNNKGVSCWHLKPDYINDEALKKTYREEREMWPSD